MGGERWLMFSSIKQGKLAKEFLAGLGGENIAIAGDGVWLDWSTGRRLSVGYSFGGMGDTIAAFVCKEIAQRFKIHRIGADSTGWYSEDDCRISSFRDSYGGVTSWAEWMAHYRAEWGIRGRRELLIERQKIGDEVAFFFATRYPL